MKLISTEQAVQRVAERGREIQETLSALAKNYREKMEALFKYEGIHERLFTPYLVLKEAAEVAENELKTKAKALAVSYEGEGVDVEYCMPKKRFLDPRKIRKLVSKDILDSLDVITSVEQVDEKALKALVRLGKIKKSVLEEALVEIPTDSPRVTIKLKD